MDIYNQTLGMAAEHANEHKEEDVFSSPYMARMAGWVAGFCAANTDHNGLLKLIETAFHAGAGIFDTTGPEDHRQRAQNLVVIEQRLDEFKAANNVPEIKALPKALAYKPRRRRA